jgi:DNA-binding protein HU-beta
MNKGELIEAVASATGSTKAEAGRAIDATVAAVTGALKKGDSVTLIGFGS